MMQQEVFHRMQSGLFIHRSHSARYMNLKNDSTKITKNATNDSPAANRIIVTKTIIDMYGSQMNHNNLESNQLFTSKEFKLKEKTLLIL